MRQQKRRDKAAFWLGRFRGFSVWITPEGGKDNKKTRRNDGRDTQFNGNDNRVEIIHPYFTITANFYVVGNEAVENAVW